VQLATEKHLNLKQLKFFVIDECDKVLEKHGEFGAALWALLCVPGSCFCCPCEYACTCVSILHHLVRVLVQTTVSARVAMGCMYMFQWLPLIL
jgi:hypothetical protein